MANSLLTPNMILREALRLFKNTNAFIRSIDRQYDDRFANAGAPGGYGKIGPTLRIRLPNDYTVRSGPTAVPQDTVERSETLTVGTQIGVDISFSSVDRALSLQDYSKRIIGPAVNALTGGVATNLMTLADGVPNIVVKTSAGAIVSPDMTTWLSAGANLDFNNAPRGERKGVLDPLTQARTVASFAGLFNPQGQISDQYRSGFITNNTLGVDEWMMDQTTIVHSTAAYGTLPTVAGANQTGSSITVSTTTAPINNGDIITIAGVNAVNRVTKSDTGTLRQFVVTANVPTGSTSIPIYPALSPAVSGNPVPYQTVTASPANGATISVVTPASSQYRKNLVFAPEAFTMVTADLEIPGGVHEAERVNQDGISMRLVTYYAGATDQFVTRIDMLYGIGLIRPEWAAIVADMV